MVITGDKLSIESTSSLFISLKNCHRDYYRFSEQTFKEVFFEGFNNVIIKTVMIPSRTIAYCFKN